MFPFCLTANSPLGAARPRPLARPLSSDFWKMSHRPPRALSNKRWRRFRRHPINYHKRLRASMRRTEVSVRLGRRRTPRHFGFIKTPSSAFYAVVGRRYAGDSGQMMRNCQQDRPFLGSNVNHGQGVFGGRDAWHPLVLISQDISSALLPHEYSMTKGERSAKGDNMLARLCCIGSPNR